MLNADAAAICPDLADGIPGRQFFITARDARDAIKARLSYLFALHQFDIYVGFSVTSWLYFLIANGARYGLQIAAKPGKFQHYEPYENLLRLGLAPGDRTQAHLSLVTHVSPITGIIDENFPAECAIVDASQSFGLPLFGNLVSKADVILFPAHKHCGLAVGAAFLLIRRGGRLGSMFGDDAKALEQSYIDIEKLRTLESRLTQTSTAPMNSAYLAVNEKLRIFCQRYEISIASDDGEELPMVSLIPPPGMSAGKIFRTSHCRIFPNANLARFSYYARNSGGNRKIDCTESFKTQLLESLNLDAFVGF